MSVHLSEKTDATPIASTDGFWTSMWKREKPDAKPSAGMVETWQSTVPPRDANDGAGEASQLAVKGSVAGAAEIRRPADAEGCVDYVGRLIDPTRSFATPCATEVRGRDFTADFFSNGHRPVVIKEDLAGLGIVVPEKPVSVGEVVNLIGSSVSTSVQAFGQPPSTMTLSDWAVHVEAQAQHYIKAISPEDQFQLNAVVDLDFHGTDLADQVEPPVTVTALDWACNDVAEGREVGDHPLQRVCSMAVAGNYTDFRLCADGRSSWQHVFTGMRNFYMVEPTDANLLAFEEWVQSENKNEVFFGDMASTCSKVEVKEGSTLIIPTGWIFAEHTLEDAVLFGGYFLLDNLLGMQIKVADLLQRVSDPDVEQVQRGLLHARHMHYYAADVLLAGVNGDVGFPEKQLPAVAQLVNALERWSVAKLLPLSCDISAVVTGLREHVPAVMIAAAAAALPKRRPKPVPKARPKMSISAKAKAKAKVKLKVKLPPRPSRESPQLSGADYELGEADGGGAGAAEPSPLKLRLKPKPDPLKMTFKPKPALKMTLPSSPTGRLEHPPTPVKRKPPGGRLLVKATGVGRRGGLDPPPANTLMDESDDDLDNIAERVPNSSSNSILNNNNSSINNASSSTCRNPGASHANDAGDADSFKSPSLAESDDYRVSAGELADEALEFREDARFEATAKTAAPRKPKPSPRPRKAALDDEDWMPELQRPLKKARSAAKPMIGGSASKAAMANIMRAKAAAKPAKPRAKAKTLTPQQRLMNKMKKFGRRR